MRRSRGLSSRPRGEREPAEPATRPLGLRKRKKIVITFFNKQLVRIVAPCATQQLSLIRKQVKAET